ncbi:DUF4064 domain-containing protein [Enterococcus faecalis]|nr:DUF4064 domain-containing protein [Enterococcus faecalis]
MNPRKTELILTLISGITGILISLFSLAVGLFMSSPDAMKEATVSTEDINTFSNLGGNIILLASIALIISVVLFILAFFLKKNQHTVAFGLALLILSIVPFFLLTFAWLLPGILGIIPAIMLFVRRLVSSAE